MTDRPLANQFEEFDWQPASNAACDGSVCAIRIRDRYGSADLESPHVLLDDGQWALIEPPTFIEIQVTHFRHLRQCEVDAYYEKLRRSAQRAARKSAA